MRNWFLLPARLTMAILFAAPLLIVCAYSLLTRGDYGGVEYPWTRESYSRLFDPLYGVILVALLRLLAGMLLTLLCAALGFLCWRCSSSLLRTLEESLAATGHPAVLDQLSGPHLRLAFSAEGDRPDQYGIDEGGADPYAAPAAVQQWRGAVGPQFFTPICRSWCCHSMRPWSASTPPCWKPQPTWGCVRCVRCSASSCP